MKYEVDETRTEFAKTCLMFRTFCSDFDNDYPDFDFIFLNQIVLSCFY